MHAPGLWIRIELMQIRIQHFSWLRIRIRIQFWTQGFDDQKLEKIYSWKKWIFFDKNFNLVIPRSPYRTHKLQEKPSALKKEHPALQNMKFFYFFLYL